MIAVSQHIIKSQQFEIALGNPKKGHAVQSAISVLQTSRLENQLHTILERFSQEGKVFHFDQIALDLGTIATWNFEEELVLRLEEALVQFFRGQLRANGSLKNGKEIILKNKELDQLEHFLLWGYFLWNSSHNQSARGLMERLMESEQEALVPLLSRLGKKEVVRKRIIFQFGETILDNIVLAVAKREGEPIIEYKNKIIAHQRKERFVEVDNTDFRDAVWEIVLSYIFVESGGYYTKKSFLEYLIRRTAQKYNLGYGQLLGAIARGVENGLRTKPTDEFKKIVLELLEVRSGQSTKNPHTNSKNEKRPIEIKQQLIYYLAHGTFPVGDQPLSRSEVQHFFAVLSKRNSKVLHQEVWQLFSNPVKSEKLLTLLDGRVLERLVETGTPAFLTKIKAFFSVLENKQGFLSPKSQHLFKRVIHQKHALILKAFAQENNSYRSVEETLLKVLLHLFSRQQDIFLQALYELVPHLSGAQMEKVVDFLKRHGGTEISKSKNGADTMTADRPDLVIDKTKEIPHQIRWENVQYVLQKGSLPWWSAQYTLEQFNSDFAHLWTLPTYQGRIRTMAQRGQVRQAMATFLNDKNLIALYAKMDGSFDQEAMMLFERILELFKEQPYSIQNQLLESFFRFKVCAVAWVLQKQESSDVGFLHEFFRGWQAITIREGNQGQRNIIQQELKELRKKLKGTRIKKVLDQGISFFSPQGPTTIKNRFEENVVSAFIRANSPDLDNDTSTIKSPLEAIVLRQPKKVVRALANDDFREGLLQQLPPDDILLCIIPLVGTADEEFLRSSQYILKTMPPLISTQQLRSIQHHYLRVILKQMGTSGFTPWNADKWQDVLLTAITDKLGTTNAYETVAKLQKQLNTRQVNEKAPTTLLSMAQKAERTLLQRITNTPKALEIKDSKKKPYKKLGEKDPYQFIDPIYINNAGLVIVSPFLKLLFERSGLMEKGKFKDDFSAFRAVHLLEYVVTGKIGEEEPRLALNKALCGLPVTLPIPLNIILKENEKETADGMLQAITQQWKALNNTSIGGLRNSFLKREGKLEDAGEQFYLNVEQQSFDMLLDQLPWSIGKIKLSWMKKIMDVAWR